MARRDLTRTLGPLVVRWIERYLVHGPGDVQGQEIRLDREQIDFVCDAYRIDDHGRRVVRRAVYSRAKGRAKSELAAMLACAELLGPVRFAEWGDDGRPVGRPVSTPVIPIVATEEGQAGNVYAAAEFMLERGRAGEAYDVDVGQTRTLTPDGGYMRPVTSRASSKDGGKETFAVFDETHLYVVPELRRLFQTIRRNLSKRREAQPWSLETSTMYAPGEGSIAEQAHEYARAIEAGTVPDDLGFLFDHVSGPDPDAFDFDDDEQLLAALTTAYGEAAGWMDLHRMVADARDPTTGREDFVRYFLNVPQERASSWIKRAAWEPLERSLEVEQGADVSLGFDGSYNGDSTALVGFELEHRHVFKLGVWERQLDPKHPEYDPNWTVPVSAVTAAVARAFRRYNVVVMLADPPRWHREIEEWQDEYGDDVVIMFDTNKTAKMAEACDRFYALVLDAEITHDGSEEIGRHLRNAVTRETRNGAYITKDSRGSPRKIDAAIGAVLAVYGADVEHEGGFGMDLGDGAVWESSTY